VLAGGVVGVAAALIGGGTADAAGAADGLLAAVAAAGVASANRAVILASFAALAIVTPWAAVAVAAPTLAAFLHRPHAGTSGSHGGVPRYDGTPLPPAVLVAALAAALALRAAAGALDPLSSLTSLASLHATNPRFDLNLWWYLHAVALPRFVPYFRALARLQPLLFAVPATLRLVSQPYTAWLVAYALAALLDPTPAYSGQRVVAAAATLAALPRIARRARPVTVWAGIAIACAAVAPAMRAAWLTTWAGNANYLWPHQMLFTLAGGMVVAEFTAAALRCDTTACVPGPEVPTSSTPSKS